jgi:DNA-binding CsgD family transcriptional regulator
MPTEFDASIVDLIYEAAVIPEKWPDVLQAVANLATAKGGILIAARGEASAWLASSQVVDDTAAYFAEGYATRDTRTVRLLQFAHPGFVTDYDVYSPEEYEVEPMIRDFFRPRGLGWGVATAINSPSGDLFILHCERRYQTGPVERATAEMLDGLRPHLARAALLSWRIDQLKAQATVQALQLLDLPSAVLSHSHGIVAANEAMIALMPDVVQDRAGGIVLTDKAADRQLKAAVALVQTESGGSVQSIPVRSQASAPMILHVIPVRGEGRDILAGARCVLIVTALKVGVSPAPSLLQGLFDLTPAEARVAAGIAQSVSVKEIALTSGTGPNTVRNHLKAIMDKTGCRRQSQLVSLLAGLSPASRQH